MDAATKDALQAWKPVGGFKIGKEAGEIFIRIKLQKLAGNTIVAAISPDFDTSHLHELLFNSAGGIFW